jgi:hypothetical protein
MVKEKEAEKREPKVKRINRSEAANQVLSEFSGKATLTELAEKANQLVVASGGKANVKETAFCLRRALTTVEALGLVKITRPTDMFIEKVKVAK